jgi:hypothetical protein
MDDTNRKKKHGCKIYKELKNDDSSINYPSLLPDNRILLHTRELQREPINGSLFIT